MGTAFLYLFLIYFVRCSFQPFRKKVITPPTKHDIVETFGLRFERHPPRSRGQSDLCSINSHHGTFANKHRVIIYSSAVNNCRRYFGFYDQFRANQVSAKQPGKYIRTRWILQQWKPTEVQLWNAGGVLPVLLVRALAPVDEVVPLLGDVQRVRVLDDGTEAGVDAWCVQGQAVDHGDHPSLYPGMDFALFYRAK